MKYYLNNTRYATRVVLRMLMFLVHTKQSPSTIVLDNEAPTEAEYVDTRVLHTTRFVLHGSTDCMLNTIRGTAV